jgi:hypothetical protein
VLVAIALAVALVAGAWEIRQLDREVHDVRAEVGALSAKPSTGVQQSLTALGRQAARLRESSLRQEFELPINSYVTQLVVAVEAGSVSCAAARERWQSYVNTKVIPVVNDPANRALKAALREDDPDYHAALLNAFTMPC